MRLLEYFLYIKERRNGTLNKLYKISDQKLIHKKETTNATTDFLNVRRQSLAPHLKFLQT